MLRPLLTTVTDPLSLQISQPAMFRQCHAFITAVATGLIAVALTAGTAFAQQTRDTALTVHPLRIDLPASASTRQLTIKNTSDEALPLKLRLTEWPSDNELFPRIARGLLVTPMMLTLPANTSRDVRVGRLRDAKAPEIEQSYQLLISSDTTPDQTVKVPVFIPPMNRQSLAPQITAQKQSHGLTVTLSNSGNTHLHLSEIQLQQRDATPLQKQNLDLYIPAGHTSSYEWHINNSPVPAAAMVKLTINQREYLHAVR